MNGKFVVLGVLGVAAVFAATQWYFQTRAYYAPVTVETLTVAAREGAPLSLTPVAFSGIDADSSPLRFRACVTFDAADTARLTEDAMRHPEPVPLVAPGWFDCFDADALGADLESGAALGLMAAENIVYGIDRTLALYPDGRAYAWHQINACGAVVFDGDPPPPGCPPAPRARDTGS